MSQISTHKSIPNAFTNEEEKAMWQFLRGKLQNVKTGKVEKLEIRSKSELWDEFRRETNGTRRCRDYEKRFDYTMAPNLHKADLGLRTKTELYFGMDIPVDSQFQTYLCQIGETEIDEAGCLVAFKEFKKGGLELKSEHVVMEKEIKEEIETETPIKLEPVEPVEPVEPEHSEQPGQPEQPEVSQEPECSNAYYERQKAAENPPEQAETSSAASLSPNAFTSEEEMDMWIFLLQKLHNPRSGKVEKLRTSSKFALWNEFKKITHSKRRPMEYEKRFSQHMASALHTTDFDNKTKIELYYGLQIPVDPTFLASLEKSIDIKLDKENIIEKYKDDGGMRLGCPATVINFDDIYNNNRGYTPPRDDEPECSNAYYERERLEKQRMSRRSSNTSSVISSSKSEMPATRSAYHRRQHDMNIKPETSSSHLKRPSSVYVESEIPLKSEPSRKSKKRTPTPKRPQTREDTESPHFTSDEELDMWIFLLQKIRNPDTGKAKKQSVSSSYEVWAEFKKCSNGAKSADQYLKRFELIMRDYLHLTSLTQQMKLELYFGLGLPVEPSLLDELQANADVVVDGKGCLVMYKERRTDGEKFMLGEEEVEIPSKKAGKQSAELLVTPKEEKSSRNKLNKKTIKNHVKSEPSSQEDSEAGTSTIFDYEQEAFEDWDPSYIHHHSSNKRKKQVFSSDDSEDDYAVIRRKPKKSRKLSARKVYSDSEDQEEERERFVPEPPKFVRQPIAETSYEGPFITKNVYLNILKNVLTKIEQSEELADLRKMLEEKIECYEEDKLISVGYMKHVIDSIFATCLSS